MAQLLINPRKRRKARKSPVAKKRVSRRRSLKSISTVARKAIKRYRRNPMPKLGGAMDTVKNGAIGAAGAVISEVVLSKLPLPAAMQSGAGLTAAKALVGVGVGMAVSKFLKNRSLGKTMAEGAVTIALHDTIRGAIKGPLGLSGYGDGGLLGMSDAGLLGYYGAAPSFPTPETMGYYDNADTSFN